MAFESWNVDADDKVLDRRAIPYAISSRDEAVEIESVLSSLLSQVTRSRAIFGGTALEMAKRGSGS
jgi:hypothetical protein